MSGSGGSKAIKGGDWTGKMYFDPEASRTHGKSYWFTDDELREELLKVIEPEEKSLKVFVFNNPLSSWQLRKMVWKHTFIVLETNAWWWSLEKNTQGITLQRDLSLEAVRDRYRQQQRTTGFRGIGQEMEDEAQGTMEDLVRWLWRTNVLNQKYDLLYSSCYNFGKAVFNHVAVNKRYA